jgi:transposase-like protein
VSAFEPCPFCQHDAAQPVRFTHWGGIIGPRLMSLVKCKSCGKQFNGRSGTRVEKAIKVYTWVAMATLAIVAAWAIYSFIGPSSNETAAPSTPRPAHRMQAA